MASPVSPWPLSTRQPRCEPVNAAPVRTVGGHALSTNATLATAHEHSTADTSAVTAEPEPAQHAPGSSEATLARQLAHSLVHVLGLIAAHTAAIMVLEKTPLLALLSLH